MPNINKKDFVEVEYTGSTKEDNLIFDTTSAEVAKENNIYAEKMQYGPVVVCIGEGQILEGLENPGADWVKLEVLGDTKTLLPDPVATLEATESWSKKGFRYSAIQRMIPLPPGDSKKRVQHR